MKQLTRRDLLKSTAAVSGGLVVAYYLPPFQKAFAEGPINPALNPAPNFFVQIAPDSSITMVINKLEMGQGVNTSMAQLIAEELDCDWTKIKSVSAPVNPVYNHTKYGMQMAGGSSSLSSSWDQHRKIGAAMREMLCAAAAQKWNVPVTSVKASNGMIHHPKKGKLTYGEVAEDAAKLELPQNPKLKDPKNFKIIGKAVKRVDAADKSNGKAVFGMDVRIPGMLYAVIARPPLAGARFRTYRNEGAAKKVPGVIKVVEFGDRVAVLAKNSHAARLGRDALELDYVDNPIAELTSAGLMKAFKDKAEKGGVRAANRGDLDAAKIHVSRTVVADYEFPYLAHACMEPMNCTINYDGKTCEIWSGHQMPTADLAVAAKILGLKPESVKVNTVYAGGSFGRRASKTSDYVVEACQLAKEIKKPLKVVWTREDDMRGGSYRPMNFHRVKLMVDSEKKFLSWNHFIVGQSVIAGSPFEPMMVKDGLEATINEGVSDTKYDFKNFRCTVTREISQIPTLWWRSVGHTHTAYVMETMVDELAELSNTDPLQLRMELLKKSPRHMAVLELIKKETGWGRMKPPKGRAWGLAVHESFNSVVAEVAEVSVTNGTVRVHKVWAAVECGMVVNPEGAKTQIESGIVFGLSAALFQQIQIKDGRPVESNFHDYQVMRMTDMPVVKVAFTNSKAPPTGLGEPGVPPAAPAVANAIYKLKKLRLRTLPFSRELKA